MEERISQKLDIYCLDNAPNLTEAISQGLRGQRLMPALYKDLGTWIFEDPDMWPPCVQTEYGPTFQVFQTPNTLETTEPNLWTLPLDILFEVLLNLSLIDVLNTSAICKPMRNYLLAEKVFISLLRKMVLHGSLRWIQPCGAVEGEVKSARKDLLSWIGTDDLHDHIKDPLLDAKFPILHFVHACYKSDSMKSRKRLWGIAKQLEGTWNPDFASAPKAASSDEEPDSELEDYSD
ncbi:hypothetical protein DL96DRAFT_1459560 [Flagelloscypha sp. PMI_526]|nr:hypothetical protein DL96DRAFT_1459560 [Flagelloscypha sp. PMI_526]